MLANLKYVIRNRENATIGGGVFSPDELADIVRKLEALPALVSAMKSTLATLEDVRGNINPERGFCDELERDIAAAIEQTRAALLTVNERAQA